LVPAEDLAIFLHVSTSPLDFFGDIQAKMLAWTSNFSRQRKIYGHNNGPQREADALTSLLWAATPVQSGAGPARMRHRHSKLLPGSRSQRTAAQRQRFTGGAERRLQRERGGVWGDEGRRAAGAQPRHRLEPKYHKKCSNTIEWNSGCALLHKICET
jgi:hypothetical protein